MKNLEGLHFVKNFKVSENYKYRVEVKYCSDEKILKARCVFERENISESDISEDEMMELYAKTAQAKNFFSLINSWCKETAYSGISERLLKNLRDEFNS